MSFDDQDETFLSRPRKKPRSSQSEEQWKDIKMIRPDAFQHFEAYLQETDGFAEEFCSFVNVSTSRLEENQLCPSDLHEYLSQLHSDLTKLLEGSVSIVSSDLQAVYDFIRSKRAASYFLFDEELTLEATAPIFVLTSIDSDARWLEVDTMLQVTQSNENESRPIVLYVLVGLQLSELQQNLVSEWGQRATVFQVPWNLPKMSQDPLLTSIAELSVGDALKGYLARDSTNCSTEVGDYILDRAEKLGITDTSVKCTREDHIFLQIKSLTVNNLGPFGQKEFFDLSNCKGVGMVTANIAGLQSNGMGKSTLCISTFLWLLTGQLDNRPSGHEGQLKELMTDPQKKSYVMLQGKLNGGPISITREYIPPDHTSSHNSKYEEKFFAVSSSRKWDDAEKFSQEIFGMRTADLYNYFFCTMAWTPFSPHDPLSFTKDEFRAHLEWIFNLSPWESLGQDIRLSIEKHRKHLDNLKEDIKSNQDALDKVVKSKERISLKIARKALKIEELESKHSFLKSSSAELLVQHQDLTKKLQVYRGKLVASTVSSLGSDEELDQKVLAAASDLERCKSAVEQCTDTVSDQKAFLRLANDMLDLHSRAQSSAAESCEPDSCALCLRPFTGTQSVEALEKNLRKRIQDREKALRTANSQKSKAQRETKVARCALKDLTKQQDIRKKNRELQTQIEQLEVRISELNVPADGIVIGRSQREYELLCEGLADLKSSMLKLDQEASSLIADVDVLRLDELAVQNQLDMVNRAEAVLGRGCKNFKTQVLWESLRLELQVRVQCWMNMMFAPPAHKSILDCSVDTRLEIHEEQNKKFLEFSFHKSRDKFRGDQYRPVSSLSAAEHSRFRLSFFLAYGELLAAHHRVHTDLIIMDECLVHLDRYASALVLMSLRVRGTSLSGSVPSQYYRGSQPDVKYLVACVQPPKNLGFQFDFAIVLERTGGITQLRKWPGSEDGYKHRVEQRLLNLLTHEQASRLATDICAVLSCTQAELVQDLVEEKNMQWIPLVAASISSDYGRSGFMSFFKDHFVKYRSDAYMQKPSRRSAAVLHLTGHQTELDAFLTEFSRYFCLDGVPVHVDDRVPGNLDVVHVHLFVDQYLLKTVESFQHLLNTSARSRVQLELSHGFRVASPSPVPVPMNVDVAGVIQQLFHTDRWRNALDKLDAAAQSRNAVDCVAAIEAAATVALQAMQRLGYLISSLLDVKSSHPVLQVGLPNVAEPFSQFVQRVQCLVPSSDKRVSDVFLSHPGEYKGFVSMVYEKLTTHASLRAVFFDKESLAYDMRPSESMIVQNVQSKQGSVLVCREAFVKPWPLFELGLFCGRMRLDSSFRVVHFCPGLDAENLLSDFKRVVVPMMYPHKISPEVSLHFAKDLDASCVRNFELLLENSLKMEGNSN